MAGRTASLVDGRLPPRPGAQGEGLQTAFRVAMVVGLGAVVCALFLRNETVRGRAREARPARALRPD